MPDVYKLAKVILAYQNINDREEKILPESGPQMPFQCTEEDHQRYNANYPNAVFIHPEKLNCHVLKKNYTEFIKTIHERDIKK